MPRRSPLFLAPLVASRLCAAAFSLAPAGLCLVAAAPVHASTLDRVAAVVNAEIILESEVNTFAAQTYRSELGEINLDSPEGQRRYEGHKKRTLDLLIERMLVAQQAKEMKLVVTEDEIRGGIEHVKQSNNLSDEQFAEALKQQGFPTVESYKSMMRRELLQQKVINQAVRSRVSVGDDEVRSYYAQTVRQATSDQQQVHLKQIFLAVPPSASEAQLEEKRRKAMGLVAELRGGREFATVAEKNGDDAASKGGGDLGWVARGDLPTELREAVASMDTGDVKGPVKSDRGFHILLLVEKKDAEVRPFEDAKEQLRRQLYDQQVEKSIQSWLKDLRRKAHVDLRL